MIQATQIPKAPSKKENNAKTPAITSATAFKEKSDEMMVNEVSSNPRRAAKIFGPALINWLSDRRYFTILCEVIPTRLYFENLVALSRKSKPRNAIR